MQDPHTNPTPRDPSLAHNLGAFFGHIVSAIRTPVDAPQPPAHNPVQPPSPPQGIKPLTRCEHVEREVQADGSVVLRRTVIEEIRVESSAARPTPRDKDRS